MDEPGSLWNKCREGLSILTGKEKCDITGATWCDIGHFRVRTGAILLTPGPLGQRIAMISLLK